MTRIYFVTILVALVALTMPAWAQVDIVATAQPRTVSVGEMLTYEITVTIRGTSALTTQAEPSLPDFDGFDTLTTSTRQGLSMGSGGTQSERTYSYTLRASKSGDFIFSPATVQVAGKTYRSAKVKVTVTPGAGSSPRSPFTPPGHEADVPPPIRDEGDYTPKQAIDLRLSAEPEKPYVDQQVVLTFGFYYQSESLYGDTRYEPPSAEDCVVKELPAPPNSSQIVGGREYLVQKRRWALFPTAAGELEIQPVRVITSLSPYGQSDERHTNSVRLQVRPLPQPPPDAHFEGAVGRFTAHLTSDRDAVKSGETFTLSLTIRGTGNVHSLGAPTPRVPDWVNIYKSREDRDVQVGYGGASDAVGGEARFDFLALAKQSGTLNIPQLDVVYFDPQRGRYDTASTDSVIIHIEPGIAVEEPPEQPDDQMRQIKLGRPDRVGSTPLFTANWFWWVQAIPLLLLLLSAYMSHRRSALLSDPVLARSLQAPRMAQQHLAEARAAIKRGDSSAFCASAAHGVTDFIAHKFGLQAADISTQEALAALRSQQVDDELVGRVQHLLEKCDRGRFAVGSPTEHNEMLAETVQVLRRLQTVRPRRG